DPTPFSVSPCVFVPVPIPPPSGQGGGGNSTNQPPGGNVSGLPILVPPAPPAPGPSNAPAAFVKGTYNGLFSSSNGVTWANAGSFMAKTTTKGNYSAKITLAGRSYSLAGKFDSASHRASNTLARPGSTALTVQLDASSGTQIRGRVL